LQNPLPVLRKFFPLDKNYLLEEAQLQLREELLRYLVEKVKDSFELRHNPLGLVDSFSLQIRNYKNGSVEPLDRFYESLAAIYRFKCGDNQLEFIWDGRDHREKYKTEWIAFFKESTDRFCKQELFIQAVLDLTVFQASIQEDNTKHLHLAENRMNHFMAQEFQVKFLRNRGVVRLEVA
jgi:hypothetical protein